MPLNLKLSHLKVIVPKLHLKPVNQIGKSCKLRLNKPQILQQFIIQDAVTAE
jgi:hypothetical protein